MTTYSKGTASLFVDMFPASRHRRNLQLWLETSRFPDTTVLPSPNLLSHPLASPVAELIGCRSAGTVSAPIELRAAFDAG